VPLFRAATANFDPWTEAHLGRDDNTVPRAIAYESFKREQQNVGVTEFVEMPNRGHALVIDNGRREVADTALAFVKRYVSFTNKSHIRNMG
jgi:non-heme chloroperoxidase